MKLVMIYLVVSLAYFFASRNALLDRTKAGLENPILTFRTAFCTPDVEECGFLSDTLDAMKCTLGWNDPNLFSGKR
jgi:hypothetical protein